MIVKIDDKVGSIATKYPLATRVFSRHKIDFCCGGGLPLGSVCVKNNLDVNEIVDELNNEISDNSGEDNHDWITSSPDQLIDHILEKYHRPLDEELPRLVVMASKVYEVHQEKDPDGLKELLITINSLKSELEQHMVKEEQILFPMIKEGNGRNADGPINVMHNEHENAGDALKKIRDLTNDFKVPENACNTWRALWHGLEALEKDLHFHIHLENNVLFPKVQGTYGV